jgi:predicted anti-sigma-YlaC factor YlaD
VSLKGWLCPLDPIDAEALASGLEPPIAVGAALHVRECPSCRELVAQAAALAQRLDRLSEAAAPADLADRVLRLRPFSRRERRRLALWAGSCTLALSLFCAGFLILAFPSLTAREQAGLTVAAYAPLLALSRACADWFLGVVTSTPAGLKGLSDALRQGPLTGVVALLLLGPLGMGLRRVLARARR